MSKNEDVPASQIRSQASNAMKKKQLDGLWKVIQRKF